MQWGAVTRVARRPGALRLSARVSDTQNRRNDALTRSLSLCHVCLASRDAAPFSSNSRAALEIPSAHSSRTHMTHKHLLYSTAQSHFDTGAMRLFLNVRRSFREISASRLYKLRRGPNSASANQKSIRDFSEALLSAYNAEHTTPVLWLSPNTVCAPPRKCGCLDLLDFHRHSLEPSQ